MAVNTQTIGIFQSDIIIRSAIMQGLAEIRAKPYLLDFCFASLTQDQMTQNDYGQATIDRARNWFLSQQIPVKLNTTNNPPTTFPAISIQLVSSNEDVKTHGDVNYDPTEDNTMQWPILFGPFDAVSYTPSTGVLVLPAAVSTALFLSPGQLIIDKTGGMHVISAVNDDVTVVIEKNATNDFTSAVVKGQAPALITSIESVVFSETYQIGCHVMGEPEYLTWLHSIMVFILLAYKQTLLEGRGFERSVLSSSEFSDNPMLGDGTNVYSRFITLSGFIRQMWPGAIAQKITGTQVQEVIDGGGVMFPASNTQQQQIQDAPFIGDGDKGFF
jgi:hypothetical protein